VAFIVLYEFPLLSAGDGGNLKPLEDPEPILRSGTLEIDGF
jgi:hypothetical protein